MDNKVSRSIEAPGGSICVDLFRMPDGTWGFAEYRRDPEDGRGWWPTGLEGRPYTTEAAALAAARVSITWLDGCLGQ